MGVFRRRVLRAFIMLRLPLSNRTSRASLLAAAALLASATFAPARQDGPALDGAPLADGVFVGDSTAALDRFALAERLAGLEEWDKAADVYQELVSASKPRLVAARATDDGAVYQFEPVAEQARRRLAAWPPAGRAAYRARYGDEAARALETARRLPAHAPERAAALESISHDYFLTVAAVDAAVERADAELADGQARAAAAIVERFLSGNPDLASLSIDETNARLALLLRAVAAKRLSGNAADAEAGEIVASFADEPVRLGGIERSARDAVAALLAVEPVAAGAVANADRWPTLGGDVDRNAVPLVTPGRVAPLYAVVNPAPSLPGNSRLPNYEAEYANARSLGLMTGSFPAVRDGVVYWSDNLRLFALGLDGRQPPPAWVATHPGNDDAGTPAGVYRLEGDAWQTPRGAVLAPLVTETHVVATLGHREDGFNQVAGGGAILSPQVVCLDRATGRELWTTQPDSFDRERVTALLGDDAEAAASLRECEFAGAPVASAGRIWLLAKTSARRGRQFEQAFLVGLDADTGEVAQAVYLATASQDRLRNQAMSFLREPDPVLAADGDVVYAPTGRGAIAAVSATSGQVLWLNLYERLSVEERGGVDWRRARRNRRIAAPPRSHTDPQPFHVPAPLVEAGRLFYRPPDARHVLVLDAQTGERLAKLPVRGLLPGEPAQADPNATPEPRADEIRTIFAVDGERLFAMGSGTIYCLNWPAVAEDAQAGRYDDDARMDWIEWTSVFALPRDGDANPRLSSTESLFGRPVATATHVVVPTFDRLVLIDIPTGLRVDNLLGEGGRWSAVPRAAPVGAPAPPEGDTPGTGDAGEPGNVVVLADQILVAGPTRLSVFADEAAVRQKLLAQREAAPADYRPLLTLAQLEFVAGDVVAVEARLREAAALPEGRSPALESTLALAGAARDDETARRLLRAALDLARLPADRARAAFALAARQSDPAEQVATYQGVLAEPALRQAVVGAAGTSGRIDLASATAERAIRALLIEHGRALYDSIEQSARAELNAADSTADLANLATVYPNSLAAGEARLRIAEQAIAAGDLDTARPALRRLRRDQLAAGDAEAANDSLLRLARLELASDARLDLAAARFDRLAREQPDAAAGRIVLADGESLDDLTRAQVADVLQRRLAARDAALLPTLFDGDPPERPFDPSAAVARDGVERLLPVAHGDIGLLVTTDQDGAIALRSPDTLEPELSIPSPPLSPAAAARSDNGGLLLWGEDGAAAMGADGSTRWFTGVSAIAAAQRVVASPLPVATAGVVPPELRQLEAQLARIDFRGASEQDDEQTRRAIDWLRRAGREGLLVVEKRNEGEVRFTARSGRMRLHVFPDAATVQAAGGFTRRFGVLRPAAAPVAERVATALGNVGVTAASPARDGLLLLVRTESTGDPLLLAYVAGEDGAVRWVHPLEKAAASQVSAAGDYAVVRQLAGGDGSDSSRLIAVDLDTGRRVLSRPFESVGGQALLNVLPLATNELILVQPRQVSRVDLDAVAALGDEDGPATDQAIGVQFIAAQVDPLVTYADPAARWLGDPTGGRIRVVGDDLLVMSDPRQVGRLDAAVLDRRTLQPRSVRDAARGEDHPLLLLGGVAEEETIDPELLPPHQRDRDARQRLRRAAQVLAPPAAPELPAARIWSDGGRVYVGGRRSLNAYDLAAPDGTVGPHWWRDDDLFAQEFDPATNLDLLLSRRLAVLVDVPESRGRGQNRTVRFTPFSRTSVEGKGYESGLMLEPLELDADVARLAAPVADWRLTRGGLVVLDEAGNLLLIPPSRR